MARKNTAAKEVLVQNRAGGFGQKTSAYLQLRRSVLSCMLWEKLAYESGNETTRRIAQLVPQIPPSQVVELAKEARDKMQLRHVPLFLIRELARVKGNGPYVREALSHVIQRADEITEFLAIYGLSNESRAKTKTKISHRGIKAGLAAAFHKFDEYQLAKYDQDSLVKLRDALFLCHGKPGDRKQKALWQRLINRELKTPDTWEVQLSAGKDKKAVFTRLIRDGKLGGMALLKNLRGMLEAGVDEDLIRERLAEGCGRALPFRFITAAKYAPRLEDAVEQAMLASAAQVEKLPGRTLLVVDISGSMHAALSGKSEIIRMDAACAVAALAREMCEQATIYATAGNDGTRRHKTELVPARRGFALINTIKKMYNHLGGGGIFLVQCLDYISTQESKAFDRVIIFTDEQDCDHKANPATAKKLGDHNYVVNISSEAYGISYKNGWEHVDGFSEATLDYIRELEAEDLGGN